MARYIDADKLPIATVAIQPYALIEKPYNAEVVFARFIRDAPTADVREVVLCKDCKYITEHYDTDGNAPYWTCSEWDSGTDYDGFCHYAERRGGE